MISYYYDFLITLATSLLIFSGVLILSGGAIYLLFLKFFKNIFISDKEISKLSVSKQISTAGVSPRASFVTMVLLVVIIGGFLFNQFLMWRMGSSGNLNKLFSISINITKK